MSCKRIVCPPDRGLLGRLGECEVAVPVEGPAHVVPARDTVRQSGRRLMAVLVSSDRCLAETGWRDDWKGIPVGLTVPGVGRFRALARDLHRVAELDLRVFLPYSRENLTGLRVLASVGVPCGLLLTEGEADWEALSDLMTWAILESAPHAPIEPFDTLRRAYTPERYLEWGAGILDDPSQFIHLDREGRAALSRRDLLAGRFVGTVDDLDQTVPAARQARDRARGDLFIQDHPCSSCPGFRLCLGRFDGGGDRSGCSGFFSEMMDVLDQYREQEDEKERPPAWRL